MTKVVLFVIFREDSDGLLISDLLLYESSNFYPIMELRLFSTVIVMPRIIFYEFLAGRRRRASSISDLVTGGGGGGCMKSGKF